MRKEVLIAIIIGFVLGLVITFGVWTANKAMKEGPTTAQLPEETQQTPTPSPTLGIDLEISSPTDNAVSDKEKVDVAGKTSPAATVVILFQEGEKIIEADNNGNFSTEITLVGGNNEITISSIDSQGKEITKTISVVFSTAEI